MSGPLILASGSRYRRELLSRLQLPFGCRSPDIDETPLENETPEALVTRLARAKAQAVAGGQPDTWVIGSDQAAVCRGHILGKPGNAERCAQQLREASGEAVTFLTAVCLVHGGDGHGETHLDSTIVHFRELSEPEILDYVEREQPYDCAGGFKAEGLGISLFTRIDSTDPTALIGLPLIWLSGALRRAGLMPPQS
jgi:septum formation protein